MQFHGLPNFEPQRCLVYIRFPWLGFVSTRFEKQVESAVKECFSAEESLLVFYQRASFRNQQVYTVLSALLKSNVNYQFSCHCDIRYVGRDL